MNYLFVCSQGRIRSRTAEILFIQKGLQARSCGTDSSALVPINNQLLLDCDVIFCMEEEHAAIVKSFLHSEGKPIYILNIQDKYKIMEPALISKIISEFNFLDFEVVL